MNSEDPPLQEPQGWPDDIWRRGNAILAEIDRIPDLPEPFDPLEWDENGLPI
jgi:hypothetical protein